MAGTRPGRLSRGTSIRINSTAGDNPCHHCTEETGRSEDCHAKCEWYLLWHEVRVEELREKMQDFREAEDYLLYKRDILPRSRRKNQNRK